MVNRNYSDGPWRTVTREEYNQISGGSITEGSHLILSPDGGFTPWIVAFVDQDSKNPEQNAKLIAAAPKMVDVIIDQAKEAALSHARNCHSALHSITMGYKYDPEKMTEDRYVQRHWQDHLSPEAKRVFKCAGILKKPRI